MKTARVINCFISIFVTVLLATFTGGCKKDRLKVDVEKRYSEMGVPATPYSGGMHLTLHPDGMADLVPGGDIIYPGTYRISGSTIKVRSEQLSDVYEFRIISESEITHKTSGTILTLYK